jgi:3-hydroxyisobutyrate dehydrogenase-like beta-hydroxyacid dehydrogenase
MGSMPNSKPSLCFIGFGEAGQAIAAGLHEGSAGGRMSAWDVLFPQREGEKLMRAGAAARVRCAKVAADAVRDADIVISAVTAASSVEAANWIKAHLAAKPFVLDINSVSPGRKQETAKLLGDTARYVDVAVLAPIYPARHQTPMLLAGPHAAAIAPTLAALGMCASIAG